MRPIAFLPLALIGACTTAPATPVAAISGRCEAAPVQRFVGQTATTEGGTAIVAESGARRLRWIPLGAMVTMDFSDQRVNARLDAVNRITAVTCG